jgi:hypothetical protein
MNFYDEVLRELVTALGAALFVANARALARRRVDGEVAKRRTVSRSRPGSPVRGYRRTDEQGDLVQAPVARSVLYLVIGLVVMVWGIASLVSH